MEKKAINTEFLLKAGPYSHIVEAGGFLFLSGVDPIDLEKGLIITDDIEKATVIVLENMRKALEAAGASMSDVAKTTVFLVNANDFAVMNQVYKEFFPKEPPARSTVIVAALAKPDWLVEIEAIAYKT